MPIQIFKRQKKAEENPLLVVGKSQSLWSSINVSKNFCEYNATSGNWNINLANKRKYDRKTQSEKNKRKAAARAVTEFSSSADQWE